MAAAAPASTPADEGGIDLTPDSCEGQEPVAESTRAQTTRRRTRRTPVRAQAGAVFSAAALAALLLLAPLLQSPRHSTATVPVPGEDGATLADCQLTWIEATQLPPIGRSPKLKFTVIYFMRSGRFFRARVRYDAKAVATQDCRYL